MAVTFHARPNISGRRQLQCKYSTAERRLQFGFGARTRYHKFRRRDLKAWTFGGDELLKKRTRGRVGRPSSDRKCNFTGIQDLLAEDLVEEVQAIASDILSGNFWGLEYSLGAGNEEAVRPLTTSVK